MKTLNTIIVIAATATLLVSCGREEAKSGNDTIPTGPTTPVLQPDFGEQPTVPTTPTTQPTQPQNPYPGQNPGQSWPTTPGVNNPLSFYGQVFNPSQGQNIPHNQLPAMQEFLSGVQVGPYRIQVPTNMHIISTAQPAITTQPFPNTNFGQIAWTRVSGLTGLNTQAGCPSNQLAVMPQVQGLTYCRSTANINQLSGFSAHALSSQHVLLGSNNVFQNSQATGQNTAANLQSRLLINLNSAQNNQASELQRLCGQQGRPVALQNIPTEIQQVLGQLQVQAQPQAYVCTTQGTANTSGGFHNTNSSRWNVFGVIVPISNGGFGGGFNGQPQAAMEIVYTTPATF